MKIYRDSKEKQIIGLKKILNNMEKNKRAIISTIGAIIVVIGIFIGLAKKPTKNEQLNQSVSIIQMYTDNDEALEIKGYLEISEELKKFMKSNKIKISEEELSEKVKITTLMSSNAIKNHINEFYRLANNSKITKEDIYQQIKLLMVQERLVNKYLYNSYSKVNSIIEEALREYAGERYGIIDTENISFSVKRDYSSDLTIYKISYSNFEYELGNFGINKDIRKGMECLDALTTINDPNPNDNDLYNKDRNNRLKNGLIQAGKLYNRVDEEDLYSKRFAKAIKK